MEIFCFLILGGSTEDIVVLDAAPPSRTAVLANGAVRMQSPFTTPTSCGDAACRQLAMPSPSGNARSSVRPPSRDRRSSVPPRARQIFTDPLIRNSTAYRLSTLSVAGGPRYSEAGEALSAFRISKARCTLPSDRDRFLSVIEAAYGDQSPFDGAVRMLLAGGLHQDARVRWSTSNNRDSDQQSSLSSSFVPQHPSSELRGAPRTLSNERRLTCMAVLAKVLTRLGSARVTTRDGRERTCRHGWEQSPQRQGEAFDRTTCILSAYPNGGSRGSVAML